MMLTLKNEMRWLVSMLCFLCVLGLFSCSHDDNPGNDANHKTQAEVEFVFEEMPEYENQFANDVKSVSLYVFDENDIFVKVYEEAGEKLSKEGYKLAVYGLKTGNYSCIAWCGLKNNSDKQATFSVSEMKVGLSKREDLLCRMSLFTSNGVATSDKDLNDLFYGSIENMTVSEEGKDVATYTIGLIQDTKEVSVILEDKTRQKDLKASDYRFSYEDNGAVLSWDNLPTGKVSYSPYSVEELRLEGKQQKSVIAKFKLNRLMADSKGRLTVSDANSGDAIVSLPLVDYLLNEMQPFNQYVPEEENNASQYLLDKKNSYIMTFYIE